MKKQFLTVFALLTMIGSNVYAKELVCLTMTTNKIFSVLIGNKLDAVYGIISDDNKIYRGFGLNVGALSEKKIQFEAAFRGTDKAAVDVNFIGVDRESGERLYNGTAEINIAKAYDINTHGKEKIGCRLAK